VKLYAISDLHVGFEVNRQALQALPAHPDDWLILGGDLGESVEHLEFVLQCLLPRFARLLWVPGNHELWCLPDDPLGLRGEARYQALVKVCQRHGVLTPEDPFVEWRGPGGPCVLAPLFVLYDYSFRPSDVPLDRAVDWAAETGVVCTDEHFLHPDPYPSRVAWCEARCAASERRLAAVGKSMILINHFPLRQELVFLPMIPRFSIWCGTTRTEDWHRRFGATVVVSGHLHIRSTRWIDGVRFEEVSLGYPRQWRPDKGVEPYLREILPGPAPGPLVYHGR
jgi:3',5'-cyclic AMP phosphodiesterase CpdA